MDKTARTINTGLRDENFSDSEIIKKLKKLGQLHKNFEDTDILLTLASSINKNIRLLAVDNLAKIQNDYTLSLNYALMESCHTYVHRKLYYVEEVQRYHLIANLKKATATFEDRFNTI